MEICKGPIVNHYYCFHCNGNGTISNEGTVSGDMVGDIKLRHILQPGYIKADGVLLNRADYPMLFKFAQDNDLLLSEDDWKNGMQGMYSEGNGVDTFRVPDLRGQFLRGLDMGAGVDADRALGSTQEDAIRNITAQAALGGTIASFMSIEGVEGAFSPDLYSTGCYAVADNKRSGYHGLTFDASIVVPTAEENRPKNIALIAQIKY